MTDSPEPYYGKLYPTSKPKTLRESVEEFEGKLHLYAMINAGIVLPDEARQFMGEPPAPAPFSGITIDGEAEEVRILPAPEAES